jgi:hypothetical protein
MRRCLDKKGLYSHFCVFMFPYLSMKSFKLRHRQHVFLPTKYNSSMSKF